MAKREVDKRKTSKALRKLRRAADRATAEGGPGLTPWEKDFVDGVTGRLEKYGSAFRDPGKGRLEEALSQRQARVARVLDKKSRKTKKASAEVSSARRKPAAPNPMSKGSTLKRKTPLRSRPKTYKGPNIRHVEDDLSLPGPAEKRAALRVIPGGKDPRPAKDPDR